MCQVTIVAFARTVVTYQDSKKAVRLAQESQLPEPKEKGSEDKGKHKYDRHKHKKKSRK